LAEIIPRQLQFDNFEFAIVTKILNEIM
jgi:hypothetical protein